MKHLIKCLLLAIMAVGMMGTNINAKTQQHRKARTTKTTGKSARGQKSTETSSAASYRNIHEAYTAVLKRVRQKAQLSLYSLCDIDDDNSPELLILTGSVDADRTLAVYTYRNGKVLKLDDLPGARRVYSKGDGCLIEYLMSSHDWTIARHTIKGSTFQSEELRTGSYLDDDADGDEVFKSYTRSEIEMIDTDNNKLINTLRSSGGEVAAITAYYAVSPFKGFYEQMKPGDFIADNHSVSGAKVKARGNNYVFTLEAEYDDEETQVITVPKSKVRKVTLKPAYLAIADVERGATFVSQEGQGVIRIFRSNSNSHTYPIPNSDEEFEEVIGRSTWRRHHLSSAQAKTCLVMSIGTTYMLDSEESTICHYGLLPEKDGMVDMYEQKDGQVVPWVTLTFIAPYEWKKAHGDAYDAQGNLLVDMDVVDNAVPNVIAYIAEEDAIYYDGTLYYRQK